MMSGSEKWVAPLCVKGEYSGQSRVVHGLGGGPRPLPIGRRHVPGFERRVRHVDVNLVGVPVEIGYEEPESVKQRFRAEVHETTWVLGPPDDGRGLFMSTLARGPIAATQREVAYLRRPGLPL